MSVIDVFVRRHRVLSRGAEFPWGCAATTYAHDAVTRAELDAFKRQAAMQAALLDGALTFMEEEEGWYLEVCMGDGSGRLR